MIKDKIMELKNYFKILGVDKKTSLKQLDIKFKEEIEQVKHISNKESKLNQYLKLFEAYYMLRQEEPRVVYEECLDKIYNKASSDYSDYEKTLEKRFNKIILTANNKAKRSIRYLDKNRDWEIILEMIIESFIGIITQVGSISTIGLIVFMFAIIFTFAADLNDLQYLIGVVALICSILIFRARFKYLKREQLFD